MSYGTIGGGIGSPPANSYPLLNAGRNGENLVNLVFFGDSRALQNSNATYRFNQGYLVHALSMVRERFRFLHAWNFGVNGDTMQGIDTNKASKLPGALASRPANEKWDAVIGVGINDAIGGISASAYIGYFKSFVKYLLTSGVENIYVVGEVPYPSGYGGESGGQHATRIALIKDYNTELASYCSKVPGLHFCQNYDVYGDAGDPDVSDPLNNGTDIHEGSRGATIKGTSLARAMIRARGMFSDIPGVCISPNPDLLDVESITQGGTQNNFFCSVKTSGVVLARDAGVGALTVTIDSTDGTPRSFNIFNSTTTWAADVMPGDILQGCIDLEYLSFTGAPVPVELKVLEETPGTTQYWANANAGYTKGIILGNGRQVYMTHPFPVPTAKAKKAMQVYMNSGALANTAIAFKVYELSIRRVYMSPNAEYSAAATVPIGRNNIKCLTSTASAAFALTLQPLASYDDGYKIRFEDYEGAAGTKNVTITCAGSDSIRTAGSTASTKVISTNYGAVTLRVDRGANAFVVE